MYENWEKKAAQSFPDRSMTVSVRCWAVQFEVSWLLCRVIVVNVEQDVLPLWLLRRKL